MNSTNAGVAQFEVHLVSAEAQIAMSLAQLSLAGDTAEAAAARTRIGAALADLDAVRRALETGDVAATAALLEQAAGSVEAALVAAEGAVGTGRGVGLRRLSEDQRAAEEAFAAAHERFNTSYDRFSAERTTEIDRRIAERIQDAEAALAAAEATGDRERVMAAKVALAEARLADAEDAEQRGDPAARKYLPEMRASFKELEGNLEAYRVAELKGAAHEAASVRAATLPDETELATIVDTLKSRPSTARSSEAASSILESDEPSAFDEFVAGSPRLPAAPSKAHRTDGRSH